MPAIFGNGAALLLLGLAALAGAAQAVAQPEDDCNYAAVQPADVDFDQPREQLARRPDLPIPPDAVIGAIDIERRPIFREHEVEEDGWFRHWTNKLHVMTREDTIRTQLLFHPGNRYDPAVLNETERTLRDRNYLLDAWVRPYRVCGDRVDVAVVTRDLWTLRPDIGYSRSGGEDRTSLGITDNNFLGFGKSVAVKYRTGPERDEALLDYSDPNVMGSRWQADARVADNSDGFEYAARAERPFYRFGVDWSATVDARREKREDQFYFRGDVESAFQRDLTTYGVSGAYSLGVRDRTDRRLLFGYRYREDDFAVTADHPPPEPFPRDRTLSYPWIGFELIEDRFLRTMNLTRIHRIEDIREGIHFQARLGWSESGFGPDQDRLVLETFLRDAPIATQDHFLEYEVRQTGWYNADTNSAENLQIGFGSRYFHRGGRDDRSWYLAMDLAYLRNATADQRLWLGGESGLRGYPFRFQTGNRRALFTVERRYYTDWHPFELFRVGGVAFFDIGRAWFDDRPNGPHGSWLRDVGVGLRVASDRFETGKILHLDLAFPLDGGPDIDDVQLLVRGESTF